MNPGLLRERLTVSYPEEVKSPLGMSTATRFVPYRDGQPVPAGRRKMESSEAAANGELFADYRAEFNIRIFHPIKEKWRVVEQSTGIEYRVKSVEVNKPRGMKTLKCERVNR